VSWQQIERWAKLNELGKVLADATTVADLKIKDKDFLVVMVSKVSEGWECSCRS